MCIYTNDHILFYTLDEEEAAAHEHGEQGAKGTKKSVAAPAV
jgi:hypothetical protein